MAGRVERLFTWLGRGTQRHRDFARVRYYKTRSEMPAQIAVGEVFVIGDRNHPKWAILDCPCGRGHQLEVQLGDRRAGLWSIRQSRRGPTLTPSVDYRGSVNRCHFILSSGRVHWVTARWDETQ